MGNERTDAQVRVSRFPTSGPTKSTVAPWALGILVVVAPFDLAVPRDGFGPLFVRPLMVVGALLALVALSTRRAHIDRRFATVLVGFVAAATLSTLRSDDVLRGGSVTVRFALLALVAIAASTTFRSTADLSRLVDAAAAACLVAGAVGIGVYVVGHDVLGTDQLLGSVPLGRPQRLTRPFSNPNVASMVLAPLTALAVVGTLELAPARAWLRRAGAVTGSVATVLTLSRGGTAALVAGLAWGGLALARRRRLWPAFLCASAAMAIATAFYRLPQWAERHETITRMHARPLRGPTRSEVWGQAIDAFRANPVTGVGPGQFGAYSRQASSETLRPAFHAHNLVLELGATGGILLLLAVALVTRRFWLASPWQSPLPGSIAVVSALVALLVHGAVDYSLAFTSSLIVFGVVLGTCIALDPANPRTLRALRDSG